MTQKNIKLLNAFANYLTELTVITEQEYYMRRFKKLYHVMMNGVDALGTSWFRDVKYAELSIADLEWISDEFFIVPNAEDGESAIEDAYPEDVWRNAMLSKESGSTVTLPQALRIPAVRTMEVFF